MDRNKHERLPIELDMQGPRPKKLEVRKKVTPELMANEVIAKYRKCSRIS